MLLTFHSPTNPLVAALRAAGREVVCVEDFRDAHERLQGCSAYYGNLFTELRFPAAFLRLRAALRRRGIPYVFWNRDAPWNVGMTRPRQWLLRMLKPVDLYLTHSMQRAEWFSRNEAVYFPNAARPEYCSHTDLPALRDPASYHHDVCFVGTLGNAKRRACRERLAFLGALQDRMKARAETLRLCIVDTVARQAGVDEQLALIRGSKINLNYGAMCDLPDNPSWGLPERAFGIPAAGGFLLTDWRRTIPETFAEGSCDFFRDAEDCANKIAHYLRRFDELRTRAESLHRQVLDQHTYGVRASRLLELLGPQSRPPAV